MQIVVPKTSIPNISDLMRRCGYHFHDDPVTHKESWSRRLGPNHYPRLHMYIKSAVTKQDKIHVWVFDLHIDQKKPSYTGSRAHAGEYDGEILENEMRRVYGMTN